ncbi:MAG: threonine/serine exporter family protein [Alphaproteobacteria bacterium]|nr:threonine/serine exporter family protein [Alphaproteobacteria bacterium]
MSELSIAVEGRPPVVGAERFASVLVRLLRAYGAPAHRLEAAMAAFAGPLGLDAAFHVFPTSILTASAGGPVRMVDVQPQETDLDRLCAVDAVAEAVAAGRIDPTEGLARLERIEAAPARIGPALDAAGWAVGSVSAALFFGGGPAEAAVAGVVGALGCALSRVPRVAGHALVEVAVAAVAGALVRLVPGIAAEPALLGGLVGLYPGLRLTTGLADLATGHLLSGSTGLLAAGVTLLQLGFGVALGAALADGMTDPAPLLAAPAPAWGELVGLLLAAPSFAVLLRARAVHVPQIALAVGVAWAAERWGGAWLPPGLGGGVAALALTATSNALARWLDRPSAVTQVPGIWLLVPGSLGFRAVRALLAQDAVHGVEGVASTALAAMALVAGTLLANAIVPARRTL